MGAVQIVLKNLSKVGTLAKTGKLGQIAKAGNSVMKSNGGKIALASALAGTTAVVFSSCGDGVACYLDPPEANEKFVCVCAPIDIAADSTIIAEAKAEAKAKGSDLSSLVDSIKAEYAEIPDRIDYYNNKIGVYKYENNDNGVKKYEQKINQLKEEADKLNHLLSVLTGKDLEKLYLMKKSYISFADDTTEVQKDIDRYEKMLNKLDVSF